jgi:threonine-phosphate decarboxylase
MKTMKPISSLVKDNIKNLTPCVHGGEVLDAAFKSGFKSDAILDFSSSVNPLGTSKKALDAVKAGFGQIASYPDSNSTELREVIAKHYQAIDKNNVVIGNGSTELMYLFAEAFLKKGDFAVMAAPTFGEYESAVRKTGEDVKFVKLNSNFQVDPQAFIKGMAGAKMVFFCNPNNPTSLLTPTSQLTEIIEAALTQDSLVFLDEDFLEFVENEQALSMISKIKKYPNLFVLRSFTKIFGLTGLRVGYGIASEEIINALLCAKIPWNVNCLAQSAAVAALNDQEHLQKTYKLVKEEKAFLQEGLSKIKGFKIYPPDANFFFIDVRKTGLTAAQLTEKVLAQGILIRDCTSFRGLDEYYIRIAVKQHGENVRLLEALGKVIKNNA